MSEIWKDVIGYEGVYMVSTLGNVKSVPRITNNGVHICGKMLARYTDRDGYLRVHLSKDGYAKQVSVHRLVATAFIPNPRGFDQINHIDENKKNNEVSNLEWCDVTYNINFGTRTEKAARHQLGEKCRFHKLKQSDVIEIRRKYTITAQGKSNVKELAELYGVSQCEILRIINRIRWAHVKDMPEKKEREKSE